VCVCVCSQSKFTRFMAMMLVCGFICIKAPLVLNIGGSLALTSSGQLQVVTGINATVAGTVLSVHIVPLCSALKARCCHVSIIR